MSSLMAPTTTMRTSPTKFAFSTTRSRLSMQVMASVMTLTLIETVKMKLDLLNQLKRRWHVSNRRHWTRRFHGKGLLTVLHMWWKLSSRPLRVRRLHGCHGSQSELWMQRRRTRSLVTAGSGVAFSSRVPPFATRRRGCLPSSPSAGSSP